MEVMRDNSPEEFSLTMEGFCYFARILRRSNGKCPIFFLSGAFQNMDSWKHFVEFFAPDRTVLLADLPGTGAADALPQDRGLDFLARSALKVMNRCGIKAAHIVSASYGSPIAYRLAQLAPDRLDRVVLAGIMRKIPDHKRQPSFDTIAPLEAGNMKEFARRVTDGLLCADPDKKILRSALARRLLLTQLERMPNRDREKYRENTLRLLNHEPLDLSAPPRVPMLIFTGEHDIYTMPHYCREIAAAMPNSVFTTLKEADHLVPIEQLENTLALLHRFFNHIPLEGSPGCNSIEYFVAEENYERPATKNIIQK